ncbi:MAG: hypothetical protein HWN69_09840 [Desulfobacterales bacterium]|nr:hypothetical protein [Desulfobacterales bacterium]
MAKDGHPRLEYNLLIPDLTSGCRREADGDRWIRRMNDENLIGMDHRVQAIDLKSTLNICHCKEK